MDAGSLRNRVKIQRQASTQDAAGQPTLTWSDVATVWASILHKNGAETIRAGQDASIVNASIRIRWRTGIDAGMRVLHGTSVYAIQSVLPDLERREHLDLVCEHADDDLQTEDGEFSLDFSQSKNSMYLEAVV